MLKCDKNRVACVHHYISLSEVGITLGEKPEWNANLTNWIDHQFDMFYVGSAK